VAFLVLSPFIFILLSGVITALCVSGSARGSYTNLSRQLWDMVAALALSTEVRHNGVELLLTTPDEELGGFEE